MTSNANQESIQQLKALLRKQFDLAGKITRLPGENENFQLLTSKGQRFILKLAGENILPETLIMEHRVIEHLVQCGLEIGLPRSVLNQAGDPITFHTFESGQEITVRLIEFVPGKPWGQAGVRDVDQLRDLGFKLATLDLALATFEDPAVHRTHRWDLTAASKHRSKIVLVEDDEKRRILESMFHFYAANTVSRLDELPQTLIHSDPNDENLLVQDGQVVGLLDFGDCLYNPTICELAIALAYAMLDAVDPLNTGAEIVTGYHGYRPLSVPELEVLYALIVGRLCTTVLIAEERRRIDPEHPTWFSTQDRAWSLLEKLYPLDPLAVREQLCSGIVLDIDDVHGDNMEDLLQRRRRFLSPSLSIAYKEPLTIVRGSGQFLYDDRGRPYLDLVNNVCHVGHCHPRVVEAGQRQMAQLNTNTRYLYDGLTAYAERLCATLPDPLEVCFFVNSGSEANELALRLAETHTGRRDVVVIEGAYHGHTAKLIDLSPYKFMGAGGEGKPKPWVHVVPMPDGYRGIHRGQHEAVGQAYGDEVGQVITDASAPIGAFIAESLLGCGGQIIPPEGFLPRAFEHIRNVGGVCIIDEVQVGFGRVGTHFWAFEREGVVPDIVVMGKPIGNGHPMAAVVTTREIADSFATGMEFFSTFGGNPVSCAIGMAVLEVIEEQALQQHALELGQYFLDGLRALQARHTLIGDARGVGLFLGVELVRDRNTLEPAADEAAFLVEEMKTRGILLSTDGPMHNVIKMKPPMVLNQDDVDMVLRSLDDVLVPLKID